MSMGIPIIFKEPQKNPLSGGPFSRRESVFGLVARIFSLWLWSHPPSEQRSYKTESSSRQ